MKKTILFPIVLLIFTHSIVAQNELTEIEKLAATAKIWGFLKYHHPQVAEGNYNWDEQLFETLPKVNSATNMEQLSQVYLNWIESLGEVKPCRKCKPKNDVQYFDKNFDLNWLNNDQLFTTQLSEKLKYIEDNRHQGKKQYVAYYSNKLKIADFTNELDYKGFDWQNENLRLLSLFRYWNMIEYFFPYKYQTDMYWGDVLNKMIPKFLNPKSETDFHLNMVELAASIDDSHVRFDTQKTYRYFGHYYLPVKFKLIDNKAIVTGMYNDSLARINDLKIGDIITKANDKTIETIFQEEEKYIMGSNTARKRLNASYYILNGPTDSLKIEVIRDGTTATKSIKRYLYRDFNYKAKEESEKYKVLEGNIGYVDIGKVELKEVPKVMEALKNTTALIFDIRKSTGITPYYFANYITSQSRDFYKVIEPDLDYPGRFIWTKTYQSGTNGKLKYTGKVILLVDENCQSQREFTAMCLQTGDNVTTIGSQTSGADGNVLLFNMVGGFKTQISGIGIFYPDGTETQRKGVKIDIKVKPTIEGLSAGKDEILERAIEFVNK
ncbi:S41 family peptidase [Kriegella aquimaris]|uniref:C-terminal processing protease CtpA/Prc, contains a PDZ domain n=1 Tax=Kriegella aquimaris TaxID=192904 RepID=A0A1G9I5U5_9FLAO|nr:S41 family peptidase [Kriegella aquimaris]SDL20601.1 C-terminal processing protease CtpA/Prc, contains a PDZ domain [Kriegella aquimaris]